MGYRQGDPTEMLEGKIETSTAKAYLVEPTYGNKREVWIPKSQVVGMTEEDQFGNRIFTVTQWWYDRADIKI